MTDLALTLLVVLQLATLLAVVASSRASRRRDRQTADELRAVRHRLADLEDRTGEWKGIG